MNDNDMTPLIEAATTAHELFVSLEESGFSEQQALRLTAYIMLGYPSDGA